MRFVLAGEPDVGFLLNPNTPQPIPPGVFHRVEPSKNVRFAIDFFAVDRSVSPVAAPADGDLRDDVPVVGASEVGGGDPACWAGLVCFECGAIIDGGYHRTGCQEG